MSTMPPREFVTRQLAKVDAILALHAAIKAKQAELERLARDGRRA